MMNKQEFTSRVAAEQFYDSIEESYDRVSLINTGYGWVVNYGSAPAKKSELHELNEMMDKREAQINAKTHAECMASATHELALVAATEAALTGAAAEYFVAGFEGADIKHANPRAAGFECEFRAGKAARQQAERAIAARTSHLYHNIPAFAADGRGL